MVSARFVLVTLASLLLVSTNTEAGTHVSKNYPNRLQAIKRSSEDSHRASNRLGRRTSPPAYGAAPPAPAAADSAPPPAPAAADSAPPPADAAAASSAAPPPPPADASAAAPPPPAAPPAAGGNKTIIVAQKKGVLRFTPFSSNVAAGETVNFMWGAGPHTVTQSTASNICNKTKAPDAFTSGPQQAGFQFPVTIKDASTPTWFYCGVQPHCDKGMFGLINPAVTAIVDNTMNSYMTGLSAKDDSFATLMNDTKTTCKGNDAAWGWGAKFDATAFPKEHMQAVAENVMETRQFFAKNPEQLVAHGVTSPTDSSTSSDSSSEDTAPAAAASSSLVSGVPVTSAAPTMAMPSSSAAGSSSDSSTSSGSDPNAKSSDDSAGTAITSVKVSMGSLMGMVGCGMLMIWY